MHSRALLGWLAAGALAALPALRQDAPPAPPQDPDRTYSPVSKYAAGDLLKYRMTMTMAMEMVVPGGGASPMPPMNMESTATVAMKTAGVKPDGTAVVVMTTGNAKSIMNGSEFPTPPAPAITMEIDKRGMSKVRGLEKVKGAEMLGQFMNMNNVPSMGAILPERPVKIGDTWETELPSPMGGQKYKMVSTLLGVEKVGDQETLKIKQDFTVPMETMIGPEGGPTKDESKAMVVMSGSMVGSSVMNIVEGTGRLLKSMADMNADIKMTMKGEAAKQSPFGESMNMKMGMKMKMDLLSAGKVPPLAPKPVAKPSAKPSNKPNKKG
jgi:hypothetical protein